MTTPPLQIHPWTVLGIGREASPEEIRAAFREKSKKYHPDHGGDEWAFRMIQHAYDALKGGVEPPAESPSTHPSRARWDQGESWKGPEPWNRQPDEPVGRERPEVAESAEDIEIEGSWLTQVWPNAVRWFHPRHGRRSVKSRGPRKGGGGRRTNVDPGGEMPRRRATSAEALLSLKTVEVELVWIRFATEADSSIDRPTRPSDRDKDDSTLSVYLVISWPPPTAIDSAADYPEARGTLRAIIDAFERLKHGAGPTASRSKIEDGRFVGWLSYSDVTRAESAFKRFREGVSASAVSIRLRTRQERLPFQWRGETRGRESRRENGEYEPIFSW